MSDVQKREKIIRVTVVGDGFTGKTCLLVVYKDGRYKEGYYLPTVFDSYSMNIEINGQTYKIILSDTAGQEEYDRLRVLAYNDTDVFIICFSVAERGSYENVKHKWIKEIRHFRPNAKVILVATKIDLRDNSRGKCLNFENGETMKRQIRADDYIECSAKQFFNVKRVFESALLAACRPDKPKRSSCKLF